MPDDVSPDDEAALREVEWARWREEYHRIMPELWMVLGHNGRTGQPWRVVFQTRSKEEAESFYMRRAFPKRKNPNAFTYAATEVYQGGLTWDCKRLKSGDAPFDGKTPLHVEGELKAARAREAREAARAKRGRKRIVVHQEETHEERADAVAYQVFRMANPAVRVEKGLYTHTMAPGEGFPSAKSATGRAYGIHQARLRVLAPPVRIVVALDEPTLVPGDAAELEAVAVGEAADLSRSTRSYRTGSAAPVLAPPTSNPVSSRP